MPYRPLDRRDTPYSERDQRVLPCSLYTPFRDPDQKRFKLRDHRVSVAHVGAESVRAMSCAETAETPVPGQSDLMYGLAIHLERLEPLGDNGDSLYIAAHRLDGDQFPGGDIFSRLC